ncbi:hypothetical protein [Micromonospora psammae]|uniref:hypothetical protein n=1 Tax=Micromonospora sp. CPCC 205556 TaxID=3122398 RepID=UPI002FEFE72F
MSVSVGMPGETAAEHQLDGQAISQEIMMCRPLSRRAGPASVRVRSGPRVALT